ncbi:hypothetical protein ACFSWE_03665 [Leucobacter albus]|uniref:Uncharacterized protein n=1 Tax=Leucobacter albus TaxID=272210 RepID=A0ABW3TN75_9MICO
MKDFDEAEIAAMFRSQDREADAREHRIFETIPPSAEIMKLLRRELQQASTDPDTTPAAKRALEAVLRGEQPPEALLDTTLFPVSPEARGDVQPDDTRDGGLRWR